MNSLDLDAIIQNWKKAGFTGPWSEVRISNEIDQVFKKEKFGDLSKELFGKYQRDYLEMFARIVSLPSMRSTVEVIAQKSTNKTLHQDLELYFWLLESQTAAEIRDNLISFEEAIRKLAFVFEFPFNNETWANTRSKLNAYQVFSVIHFETSDKNTLFSKILNGMSLKIMEEIRLEREKNKTPEELQEEKLLKEAIENQSQNNVQRGWRE